MRDPQFEGGTGMNTHLTDALDGSRHETAAELGFLRQVPIGVDGYVLEDANGAAIGAVEVNTTTMKWKWASAGVAWPSEFALTGAGTAPPLMPHVVETTHDTFPPTSASYPLADVQYEIRQGGKCVGYLQRTSTHLVWYSVNGAPTFAVADMAFVPNAETGTHTLYRVEDELL